MNQWMERETNGKSRLSTLDITVVNRYTVDSGTFCCCLICFVASIKSIDEWGGGEENSQLSRPNRT